MGIFNETIGDNDFASIFESVKEEKKIKAEMEQADTLLKILDEMENSKIRKDKNSPAVEYLRVNGNGDIVDRENKEKRKHIMTVDELPKESEYELLFGKQENIEPQVKVETGRRLKDGKTFQKISIPGFEEFNFDLTGIRFETLLLIFSTLFFLFMILIKIVKFFKRNQRQNQTIVYTNTKPLEQLKSYNNKTEFEMETEIERRVQQRLLARINAVKTTVN
jgi:hypothetical protein